jgi:hypothetical protein
VYLANASKRWSVIEALLSHLFASYGYWILVIVVAIERVGVPVPGETALIITAVLAATSHSVRIDLVVVSAAAAPSWATPAGTGSAKRLDRSYSLDMVATLVLTRLA